MGDKLRELRSILERSNARLLPLRGRLEKGKVSSTPSPAIDAGSDGRQLQAFLVDTADAHQSEYVRDAHNRREYITGFSGSNGTAIITPTEALMWTDGRYFLQAEKELSKDWSLMKMGEPGVPTIPEWLRSHLSGNGFFAIDPYLTSVSAARTYASALENSSVDLVALQECVNPVDEIWGPDRPSEPKSKVSVLPEALTGASVSEKLAQLRSTIASKGAEAIVLTALDDIAWLLNIRGSDVAFNPVAISYAFISKDSATLFVDAANPQDVEAHLQKDNVDVQTYSSMLPYLSSYADSHPSAKVLIDPIQCNVAVFLALPPSMRKEETSVIMAQKAIKNDVEIQGMKQAHIRDGAALVRFFSWLQRQVDDGVAESLDEVDLADKQEQLRREMKDYVSLSFETISSVGSNGAVIHYAPQKGSCSTFSSSQMYLNDSGAQYLDGTTDVTRTLHFGTPSEYECRCFTSVLQGHIALARAKFPDKIEGVKLDAITRAPLWQAGLDYRHGTGHGVGAFLNVHEKGVLMSFKLNPDGLLIQDRMIVSNEPGYYEDGQFGIRIESLMLAKQVSEKSPLGKQFCQFETITMCPIQRKMVDVDMLSNDEIQWLNDYHADVREKLTPELESIDPSALEYLCQETQPIPLH